MGYRATLSYIVDSVEEQLGDVKDLIPPAFTERAANEGQRRYEPQILLPKSIALSWAADSISVALPTDFVEIATVIPSATVTTAPFPQEIRRHGNTLFFYCKQSAFTGTLHYFAHYPDITDDDDSQLPQVATDGLISYVLYKAWKKIASNRTDYRRYSTLVNNQTDISDLAALSEAHFNDYLEARDAVADVRDIEPAYYI